MPLFTWTGYFASERAAFQRDLRMIIDILKTPEDRRERREICYQIADRTSYPGEMPFLINAVRRAEATREHTAQRHLTANINSMTDMFIDNPKEGRTNCFRSRLLIILNYCKRLGDKLRDPEDPDRAENVADALELVILRIGTLTMGGNVEKDEEAQKGVVAVMEKEREFKRLSEKKRDSAQLEELQLVWNALQFHGLGKWGCLCKPCVELESKEASKRSSTTADSKNFGTNATSMSSSS